MKKDHHINPVDLGDQRIDVEQAASAGMDLHGTRSRIKRRGVAFICSSLKHRKAECPLRGGTTSGKGPSTEPGDGGDAHGGKAGSKGSGKEGCVQQEEKSGGGDTSTSSTTRAEGSKTSLHHAFDLFGNRIVARPATDAGEWREAKPMTVSLGRRCCAWTPYYMLAAISTTTMFFGACSTCWRGAKSQP